MLCESVHKGGQDLTYQELRVPEGTEIKKWASQTFVVESSFREVWYWGVLERSLARFHRAVLEIGCLMSVFVLFLVQISSIPCSKCEISTVFIPRLPISDRIFKTARWNLDKICFRTCQYHTFRKLRSKRKVGEGGFLIWDLEVRSWPDLEDFYFVFL